MPSVGDYGFIMHSLILIIFMYLLLCVALMILQIASSIKSTSSSLMDSSSLRILISLQKMPFLLAQKLLELLMVSVAGAIMESILLNSPLS